MALHGLICLAAGACSSGSARFAPVGSITLAAKVPDALWYATPVAERTGVELTTPGLVIGRNNDDSNSDLNPDDLDNVVNGPEDAKQMAAVIIRKLATPPAAGDKLHVIKKAGTGNVRVFRHGPGSSGILTTFAALPASTLDADATALINDARATDVALQVEGTGAGDIDLCVVWTGSASAEACVHLLVIDGHGVGSGFGPRIYADTDRNGSLDAADVTDHSMWSTAKGAIAFVNKDRDTGCPGPGDDQSDTSVACADDVDDLMRYRVDRSRLNLAGAPAAAGWKPTLRVVAASASSFRLFNGAAIGAAELVGSPVVVAGVTYRRVDLSALFVGAGELTLALEGRQYDDPAAPALDVFHCMTHVATNVDAACDRLTFRTTTALLQGNDEEAARLSVLNSPTNLLMRDGMRAPVMPVGVTFEEVGGVDQWLQDEMEVAGLSAPAVPAVPPAVSKRNAQLVLHLPRLRGAATWVRSQLGPNIAYEDLTLVATDDSLQYGGNIESSPAGGGTAGRIVVGKMEAPLVKRLEEIAHKQAPAAVLDTAWLAVGHVDEVAVFYPRAVGTWRSAVADVGLGMSLLKGGGATGVPLVPKEAAFFWHCRDGTRGRSPACFGSGTVTSATAKTLFAPASLTASAFTFNSRPAGREFLWLRIYDGPGRGQVAHIVSWAAHKVEIDRVVFLPTPEWTRCASDGICDPAVSQPLSVSEITGDDWITLPTAASKFIVVEDSLMWFPRIAGVPVLPAVFTAGELRDHNPHFLDNQNLVADRITSAAATSAVTVLSGLPGATAPVRLPALFLVISSGAPLKLLDRAGDAWVPGLANFQVIVDAGSTKIFLPRPYGPSTGGTDPFETVARANLGLPAASVEFVDDWDLYHRLTGEVHCGTNVFKKQARRSWP